MKKTRTTKTLAALLCAIVITSTLSGCGEKKRESSGNSSAPAVVSDAGTASSTGAEAPESSIASVISSTGESSVVSSSETSAPDETGAGLWSGATYTENTEIGAGAHSVLITVTIDGKSVVITVKSDKDNLAEMLVDAGLVEGDDSEYGLYIKRVNGVLADYSIDQAYWNLLQNGTPTAMGASSITVKDGDAYELMYVAADDTAA